MESDSFGRRILSRLKGTFIQWLGLFVAALVLVTLARTLFFTEKGVCSAVVSFSYDGVEQGLNPDGNRFDPSEMKSEELVRQAAQAVGVTLEGEDAERVREALIVAGAIPADALERMLTNTSIYGEDEIAETEEVKESAYFPSQYTVTFRYQDAGLSPKQGAEFLTALLDAYGASFYKTYGHNEAMELIWSDMDYQAYDYVDAVEILRSRLSSIRAYVARLSDRDKARFVSKETGYSFSDLVGAIDVIRSEDLQWLDAYITSNNMTKDKDNLIDYYRYKIQDAERALAQQDARLFTLNELIESYNKTSAIFPNVAGATEDGSLPSYEYTQPSAMYDSLVSQKIACQTDMSETSEQIALFTRRIERLQESQPTGNFEVVETRLGAVYEKINLLLQDIRLTADEFFKTEELKRAVQTLAEPEVPSLWSISAVMGAAKDIIITEALLFGVYILCVLNSVFAPSRKKRRGADSAREDGERATAAAQ